MSIYIIKLKMKMFIDAQGFCEMNSLARSAVESADFENLPRNGLERPRFLSKGQAKFAQVKSFPLV
jgi:hypothetical protein